MPCLTLLSMSAAAVAATGRTRQQTALKVKALKTGLVTVMRAAAAAAWLILGPLPIDRGQRDRPTGRSLARQEL